MPLALIAVFRAHRLVRDERKMRYLEDLWHVIQNQPVDQLDYRPIL